MQDEAMWQMSFWGMPYGVVRSNGPGRGFVFEHPAGATSWNNPSLQSLIAMDCVLSVDFDQCATDLRGPNGQPIRKRTRLVSNMPSVIEA